VAAPESGMGSAAVDLSLPSKTRTAGSYLWPLLDTLAVNFTLWGISYASGAPFAKVKPSDWQHNFQSGFQWDDNEFEVNAFAHPYQGGMYFTTARVNGLSFWEAVPYTMLGSYSWEYFAETEQASTNDWSTTTWGGYFFGEALYRLSNDVVDETASGAGRFWREFAAFAISPVNGLDRVISGRAWADGPKTKQFPLLVDLRLGPDGIGQAGSSGIGKTFRSWIRFDYGDLYAKPFFNVPFEAFNFSAQLSVGDNILGEGFDGMGVLLGHRFSMGANNVNLLAWTLSYEYFTNGTTQMLTRNSEGIYSVSEMGTGLSWYGHWGLGSGFSVDTEADLLAVPTGSLTSPYAKYEANRSYNFGTGGALKLEANLRHERFGRLYAKMDRYLYYILDGSRGTDQLGRLELGAYANIYRGHGLGFTAWHVDRHSWYDEYPDVVDDFWTYGVHYEVEF
jgi:hypothetical protein